MLLQTGKSSCTVTCLEQGQCSTTAGHYVYPASFSDVETNTNDAICTVLANETIHSLYLHFVSSLQAPSHLPDTWQTVSMHEQLKDLKEQQSRVLLCHQSSILAAFTTQCKAKARLDRQKKKM